MAVKHLKPKEAFALLQHNADAALVDCRTELEFPFVGHLAGAHHVAREQP